MGKNVTWQSVALLAVLGAVAVALLTLTDATTEQVIALVAVLAGIVAGQAVGGAVANGVQARVDQIHQETQAQTETIEAQAAMTKTIERRTNGELDERIAAGMAQAREEGADQAVAQVIQALRKEGVIKGG